MGYDLVVIGGGPGGYIPAIRAAQYGMKTALVEARELGGTCLNRGCVPTKALLHAANLLAAIKGAGRFGVSISGLSVDLGKVYERKDEIVGKLRDGIASLLKANGVDVYRGFAHIPERGLVLAKTDRETLRLETRNILIAAGCVPSVPPIKGAGLRGVTTSDELLSSPPDFESLTIIGGGVIGAEMASVFSGFGIKVCILECEGRILTAFDREISQNLTAILKKRGVSVTTGAAVSGIREVNRALVSDYVRNGAAESIEADRVLIATGRKPAFSGLFDTSLGIRTGRGVIVDEDCETSVEGIFAAGDVAEGSAQLAHAASAGGLRAVAKMAGMKRPYCLSAIPSCVYTEPEIAAVGLSADEAKVRGIEVKTGKYLMSANARSMIEGAERGFIKLVFGAADGVLLGAQLMCERATDLIGGLAAAVALRHTSEELLAAVSAHPSFYEGIAEAVENAKGSAIHMPPLRKRNI